jgi:predicted nucleotidyltransferase
MTTLLRPGMQKIVYVFYKNKNKKIHLRELARITGMQGQSITRYLNELEKESILSAEKQGNLKLYSLKNNNTVRSMLAFFDIERFKKLPNIRKDAIASYIKKLQEIPVFIIIFGSTAKETYAEDSDIDLLIVTNRKISAKEAEKEADAINATKISTFQITYKDFMIELKLKEDAVIQSAISTGYPILNHVYYYEALQNERI